MDANNFGEAVGGRGTFVEKSEKRRMGGDCLGRWREGVDDGWGECRSWGEFLGKRIDGAGGRGRIL